MAIPAIERFMRRKKKQEQREELRRGAEVYLEGDLYFDWLQLRKKMMAQTYVDEKIENYIHWDQYNKGENGPIDFEIIDAMAEILAYVFEPTRPTHILGILDAGKDLATEVWAHLGMREDQLTFARKIKSEGEGKGGMLFRARSYKTKGEETLMVMPCYPPGSNILVIDDVAAKFQVGEPVIRTIFQQGSHPAGLGIGMDKSFEGWAQKLRQIEPPVLGFSVVRVASIDNTSKKISLWREAAALRII